MSDIIELPIDPTFILIEDHKAAALVSKGTDDRCRALHTLVDPGHKYDSGTPWFDALLIGSGRQAEWENETRLDNLAGQDEDAAAKLLCSTLPTTHAGIEAYRTYAFTLERSSCVDQRINGARMFETLATSPDQWLTASGIIDPVAVAASKHRALRAVGLHSSEAADNEFVDSELVDTTSARNWFTYCGTIRFCGGGLMHRDGDSFEDRALSHIARMSVSKLRDSVGAVLANANVLSPVQFAILLHKKAKRAWLDAYRRSRALQESVCSEKILEEDDEDAVRARFAELGRLPEFLAIYDAAEVAGAAEGAAWGRLLALEFRSPDDVAAFYAYVRLRESDDEDTEQRFVAWIAIAHLADQYMRVASEALVV